MVTGGQIQTLTVGSKTVTQRMTKDYSSADIANQILNPLTFANMTTWIANGIESVFDGTEYVSTQGATFCNLLSWGTMPDGLYYPNITFQAVSSVVAAVSHFMSMQYDGSVVGMCEFQGYAKAGNITVPSASSSFVIAMSIITMALLFVQLGKFSWSFWPTWRSNKVKK